MLAVFGWPQVARITRGSVIEVPRHRLCDWRPRRWGSAGSSTLLRHVLPNAIGPVIVDRDHLAGRRSSSPRPRCRILGVGLPPTTVSWGGDINLAQARLRSGSPILFYPAGALAITVLAFMMMGDALRDALDPESRSVAGMTDTTRPLLSIDGPARSGSADRPARGARRGSDRLSRADRRDRRANPVRASRRRPHAISACWHRAAESPAASIVFDGRDITHADRRGFAAIRGGASATCRRTR